MEPSNTLNRKRTSPFRYGFGMLGTSIPINMLKSYAAAYYVLKLGLITTDQMAKILFIYTFVDAIDNPVYGFLSDRTHTVGQAQTVARYRHSADDSLLRAVL